MKLIGFLFIAVSAGVAIAGYNMLSAGDKKALVNTKTKKFAFIVLATVVLLFLLAALGSIFSVKLF